MDVPGGGEGYFTTILRDMEMQKNVLSRAGFEVNCIFGLSCHENILCI